MERLQRRDFGLLLEPCPKLPNESGDPRVVREFPTQDLTSGNGLDIIGASGGETAWLPLAGWPYGLNFAVPPN